MSTRIACLFACLVAPLAAQARATQQVGPAALGATCYLRHQMPLGLVGHVAGFLWSAPYTGAVPVAVPGFAVNGLLRVDPAAFVALGLTVTNGVDLPSVALPVPYVPSLVGNPVDCQSFDLDLASTFHLASNDVLVTVVDGPDPARNMAPITPGAFVMGSTTGSGPEQPVHAVTLTYPFWIGAYEVTQAEYAAVMNGNPSFFVGPNAPNAAQRPADTVSWNNALTYCQALTGIEQAVGRVPPGYEYRLPTEAEWEYCCRAGTTTPWHTGASLATPQANFGGALASAVHPLGQTAPVGGYAPNPWGLFDLHGNVAEWVLDTYGQYPAGAVVDPFATGGVYRVYRGGSWFDGVVACRSPARAGAPPANASIGIGFRVVLAPVRVP
jgi:formylglycine-generating enzyme required for sulfatase activity